MGLIDLNSINKPYLTKELLLSEVSDENIFRYYIKNLHIGKIMNSPLRKDIKPSFGVFLAKPQNELFFKDFRLGSGDCVKFVSELLNISYSEALNQIGIDFGLDNKYKLSNSLKTPVQGVYNKSIERTYENIPKIINVTYRQWENHDIKFWEKFGITVKILEFYKVFPIKWLFINDNVYAVDRHAYAYQEFKDDILTYKIYQPYSEYKWISNHDKTVHQGYSQLPKTGDLLIITKALKDVMSLCAVMKIPSIGLQNETVMTKDSVIQEYKDRFKRVITLFDNDPAGITLAFRYNSTYDLPIILLPYKYGCKDFSDLVKKLGVDKAREILKELIL